MTQSEVLSRWGWFFNAGLGICVLLLVPYAVWNQNRLHTEQIRNRFEISQLKREIASLHLKLSRRASTTVQHWTSRQQMYAYFADVARQSGLETRQLSLSTSGSKLAVWSVRLELVGDYPQVEDFFKRIDAPVFVFQLQKVDLLQNSNVSQGILVNLSIQIPAFKEEF